MLNEYRKFLIDKGFAVQVNGRPSSVYDYCRGIKFIMKHLNIGIDELGNRIQEINSMYHRFGRYEIQGRFLSRSVRAAAYQYLLFMESKAA